MLVDAIARWWVLILVLVLPCVALGFWSARASSRMLFVVGGLISACGAVGLVRALTYLLGALSPDNRTNELRDLGVGLGIAGVALSALAGLGGLVLISLGTRHRRREAS